MKKIIAIIAVVLVLVAGFVFVKSRDSEEVPNPVIENHEQISGEQASVEQVSEEETSGEETSGEQTSEEQVSGEEIEKIKAALAAEGEWRPSRAFSGDENIGLPMYGTLLRVGGSIKFSEDGSFVNSLVSLFGGQSDESDYGTYEIDVKERKITFNYDSGMVMNGAYVEEDGIITKIIYEEKGFIDDNCYIVEFDKKTEEQKKSQSLMNSLISARWIPTSANANGETVELTKVYGENYKDTQGIMFEIIGDFYKDYVTSELDGIYEDYGFYWIDIENKTITYQLVKKEDGSRVDIIGSYEEENDEITKITFTENFGTENEVEVIFEPVVF